MGNLYVGLLHHPMRNRQGEIVTTSMTSMDVHDIARTARTYDVLQYYIITPHQSQREIARRIKGYWTEAEGRAENTNRGEALELVLVLDKLESSIEDIMDREDREPLVVGTSARDLSVDTVSYSSLRRSLQNSSRPVYLLFGTGWGIADELLDRFDCILEPVRGIGDFNHLSVRAAVAIILDRVRGASPAVSSEES
ncbi:MAG: RNA methyltransferase [Candidatus Bipolaricaulota bacterium]